MRLPVNEPRLKLSVANGPLWTTAPKNARSEAVDTMVEVKPPEMPLFVKLTFIESANAGVANNTSNTVHVKRRDFITAPPATSILPQDLFSVPYGSLPGVYRTSPPHG